MKNNALAKLLNALVKFFITASITGIRFSISGPFLNQNEYACL